MRADTNTPAKNMVELDTSVSEKQISFLEEDLHLSSSAQESIHEKTITESEDKTHDESTRQSFPEHEFEKPQVIYVSEDAMDCNYDEQSNISISQSHIEIEEASSPELFDSDADDEAESTASTFPNLVSQEPVISLPSPQKLSQEELIFKADRYLRRRINRFLSGVPPPPNHTISQKDCDDFLVYIKQNRQYFWADPFALDQKPIPGVSDLTSTLQESTLCNEEKPENTSSSSTSTTCSINKQMKAGLRNLSTAFDACERTSNLNIDNNSSLPIDVDFLNNASSFSLSETLLNSTSFLSISTLTSVNEDSKLDTSDTMEKPPTLYYSASVNEVANMEYPEAFKHRCHDIYYNRNRATEDFENLRWKLCERYIGAETQTTCNAWFAKQLPGSARKRLLAKRNNGQSPGKRLSYLARRRRTFSSANLQGLVLAEKKQIYFNAKKGLVRKGKSPRGKSPRGKSPRGKTPRSSAKKRLMRRYLFEEPSPRKTKIETSKRALFQSPPNDRAGPSRVVASSTVTTNNNPQKIKRALFPTPKKNDDSQTLSYPESRKRKSEEELDNPKQKFAKSLSFDCARNFDNSSSNPYNPVRHSTGAVLSKDNSTNSGKCELSETHRKKLLWAVAEALRSKGVGMGHPMFKQYATNLARTVRKFMPDLENKNIPRKPGSTSDRMLKLAKRHVILIVESKTATN